MERGSGGVGREEGGGETSWQQCFVNVFHYSVDCVNKTRHSPGRQVGTWEVCLATMIVWWCLVVSGGVMNVMNACIDCLRTRLD